MPSCSVGRLNYISDFAEIKTFSTKIWKIKKIKQRVSNFRNAFTKYENVRNYRFIINYWVEMLNYNTGTIMIDEWLSDCYYKTSRLLLSGVFFITNLKLILNTQFIKCTVHKRHLHFQNKISKRKKSSWTLLSSMVRNRFVRLAVPTYASRRNLQVNIMSVHWTMISKCFSNVEKHA